MNSVNWAGMANSTPVLFRLTWLRPGGPPMSRFVVIPIGPDVKSGQDVAEALVEVWKDAHKGGPHLVSMGTAVHFLTVVSKVEISGDSGVTYREIEPDRKIYIVPGAGNEGLCAWRS